MKSPPASLHASPNSQLPAIMSISTLPLCYCTNVHSWRTLEEIRAGLASTTAEVARIVQQPLSAGLWFSDAVSRELDGKPAALESLAKTLAELDLTCHTLNAFPHGDFHGQRVKERVYQPNWADRERLDYTLRCARILAELLPEAREGSVSTLPLGFTPADVPANFLETCCHNLCELARELDHLHSDSGRIIRLAIEPEPFCRIETTPGAIEFFRQLWQHAESAGVRDLVEQHIGLCYDVCHQAVEFEDIPSSIAGLGEAGIRINKVQISSAIELNDPENNKEGRATLANYAEPRYLHQTFARSGQSIVKQVDLTTDLCDNPPEEFRKADTWRIHFHVPVNEEQLGPLATTHRHVEEALAAIQNLEYAPHLEVETYTWSVLPGQGRQSLPEGLAKEIIATNRMISSHQESPR